MANALLAWNNAAQPGAATYVSGWAPSNGTGANLLTEQPSVRWRSGNATTTETRIEIALPANGDSTGFDGNLNTDVRVVGLMNHNLSLSATVRLYGSSNNWSSTTYDSGAISVWPSPIDAASLTGLRRNWWISFGAARSERQWRVQLTDTGNSDGYLAVGRFVAMRNAWTPTVNLLAGAGVAFEGGYEVQTTLSGAEYYQDRPAWRVARFELAATEDEMLRNGFDLARVALGTRRDVLFAYDPAATYHLHRRAIYGRLARVSALQEPMALRLQASFEVKESL